jgi:P-type E1-E2 ATPase
MQISLNKEKINISMKSKILKITNMSCILCTNKLTTLLKSIPEIYSYKINIFTKEILIKYTKNIKKILLILNQHGFIFTSIDLKTYITDGIVIVLAKISYSAIPIQILLLCFLQYKNVQARTLLLFRICSVINFILYFVKIDNVYLDNSINILVHIFINTLINDRLHLLAKVNTFMIIEKSKFRKIVENFKDVKGKIVFINRDRTSVKVDNLNTPNINYYQISDSVNLKDNILAKANDTLYINGTVLYGECLVDDSSVTGEDSLKIKKKGDFVYERSIIKKGTVVIKITGINKFKENDEISSKSNFKLILIVMNMINILYNFMIHDNLPDILESFVKINMKLCPCVFLLSDVILKMRLNKEMVGKNVNITNYDICKKIKNIFIDKTGTLTKSSKVVSFKMDPNLEGIIYLLEKEFDNVYSRGILDVINPSKDSYTLSDKEYVSSCGIRCKSEDREIRIGKLEFCNYKRLPIIYTHKNGIFVSRDSEILGYFILEDTIKKNARNVIKILQRKYDVILLSGDSKRNVEYVCKRLNISDYFYNLSSNDKASIIKSYKENNCMIGDGINDIPAFNCSTISIGLRYNLNTDVVINNSLKDLIYLLNTIDKMNRKKVTNYCISFVYNSLILFVDIGFVDSSLIMYIPNLMILLNSIWL